MSLELQRIIFAGSGEFAVPTLRALVDAGHEVAKVVTQPDRPAGRGRAMTPTPVAQCALSLGLSVVRTEDINALSELGSAVDEPFPDSDVMVVIAFGQKIDEVTVHKPRLGSVNLHASRLPSYRGAAPINWAILGGEQVTGNSVIRLAQKMDAGAILAQSEVAIGEMETAGELHDRLALDGAPLLLRALEGLAAGTAVEREQDHFRATVARKLSRDAAKLDWSRNAEAIARQIRGMYPWPGCRVELSEGENLLDTLTLVRARPAIGTAPAEEPGRLTEVGVVGVTCGDGSVVEIVELQPSGRRAMSIEAYRRGHRWEAGLTLRAI